MTALEHSRAASPDELLMLLFSDPAVRADPYPVYHQLREMAPVHRSEVFPLWVVSSFDGCGAVLRDPRFGKSDEALAYANDALNKVYGPRKIRAWHLLASVQANRKDVAGEIKAWEGMKAEVAKLPEGHRSKSSGPLADENLARLKKAGDAAVNKDG